MVQLRSPRIAAPVVDVAAWHRIGVLGSVAIATVGLLASVATDEADGTSIAYYLIAVVLTAMLWLAVRHLRARWTLLSWPLTVLLGLTGASFAAPVSATLCMSSAVLGFLYVGLTQPSGLALLLVVPTALTYLRVYHAMPLDQVMIKLAIAAFVWAAVGELPAWLNTRLRTAHADLERLAETDPLTGLANRRYWDGRLAQLLTTGRAVAVLLVDLDHFKRFNDEHGHLAGDEMLISFARMIEQATPAEGMSARWGGEEFALAVHDVARAADVAERIRRTVPLGQTCSIGLVVHRPGETATELIQRADGALYSAKTAGRDRVVAA